MRLIIQSKTPDNRSRVLSQQDADLVLGLLDELLAEDELGLGLLQQQLSGVSFLRKRLPKRSTTSKETGIEKTASSEAASMPPITTVPSTCLEMAPAPETVIGERSRG